MELTEMPTELTPAAGIAAVCVSHKIRQHLHIPFLPSHLGVRDDVLQ